MEASKKVRRKVLSIVLSAVLGCVLGIGLVTAVTLNSKNETERTIPVQAMVNNSNTELKDDSSSENETNPSESDSNQDSNIDNSSVIDGSQIGSYELSGEKVVYLTFDDGPSKLTPKILEILDKYNVKATFFVTGFDTDNAKYIKIAHDKGHTIGLHTYTHDYAKVYASPEAYYDDLNKVGELCKEQIGYVPHYIRFPGGSSNTISKKYYDGIMTLLSKDVLKKGYQYYDWNCANGDAVGGVISADELYKNAISAVGQTDLVMLCHDAGDKQTTVDSLPKIIEYYQSHGYSFKAIDDKSYVAHHSVNN